MNREKINRLKAALDAAMEQLDVCLHTIDLDMEFPQATQLLHVAKAKINRAYIKINEGDDKE